MMLMAFEAIAREEDSRLEPLKRETFHATGTEEVAKQRSAKWIAPSRRPSPSPSFTPSSVAIRTIFQRRGLSIFSVLLLVGPLMPTILGDMFFMPEIWAGVFIALSVCSYGIDQPRLGVTLGLLAVFFRELALPYCVLCAGMALWHGRRRECAAWAIGLTAWLLFFATHAWIVSGWILPDARAHPQGWIQCGAAGFVISTAQMNGFLLLMPQWATAVYLAAAVAGLAGWRTLLGTRIGLTVCLYLTAFSVVGQSFNQYWGLLFAPLLCFGLARFFVSVRDLWGQSTGR